MDYIPVTHHQYFLGVQSKLSRGCHSWDMTFGYRCLNCGWDGEREAHFAYLESAEYKAEAEKLKQLQERLLT